jgi:autotransporter-associated beta strand protein
MPHGSGAGNVLLKGGATQLAIFDIGGSTQTINGLASSNNAAKTLVTSNPGGGTLCVGANDATSRFDGILGTSGGSGTVNFNLTKIGTGTLTLGGVNTYAGTTTISNGILALGGSASIAASARIVIHPGATLDASEQADQTFVLAGGQRLEGGGTVNENLTVNPSAVLAPGDDVNTGALIVAGTAQLQGTTVLKLNAATDASDELVATAISYGGSLVVTNLAGTFAAGQTFQLFVAENYSGAFSAIELPPLSGGLVWNTNNLALDGTLQIVSTAPPQFTSVKLVGTDLILSGTNGIPGEEFILWSSPDVALPLNQWTPVLTNTFTGPTFNITNVGSLGDPARFFILSTPQ